MKTKHYAKIVSIIAVTVFIVLVSGACAGIDAEAQQGTISEENSTAETNTENTGQAAVQQDTTEQDYQRWRCIEKGCNYIYDPSEGDPAQGIAPGTSFEDLPSDWKCPICKKGKDKFIKIP